MVKFHKTIGSMPVTPRDMEASVGQQLGTPMTGWFGEAHSAIT